LGHIQNPKRSFKGTKIKRTRILYTFGYKFLTTFSNFYCHHNDQEELRGDTSEYYVAVGLKSNTPNKIKSLHLTQSIPAKWISTEDNKME